MTTQAIAESLSCSDINGARDLSITERRAAEIPYQLNQMIDEARVAAGLSGKKLQQLITGDQNTSANLYAMAVETSNARIRSIVYSQCETDGNFSIDDQYLVEAWTNMANGMAAANDKKNAAPVASAGANPSMDSINDHVRACWTYDAGAMGADKLEVTLQLTLDENGVVREARVFGDDVRRLSNPTFHAFAARAIRAVLDPRCSDLHVPRSQPQGAASLRARPTAPYTMEIIFSP